MRSMECYAFWRLTTCLRTKGEATGTHRRQSCLRTDHPFAALACSDDGHARALEQLHRTCSRREDRQTCVGLGSACRFVAQLLHTPAY
jgi:hypothetical protein